MKKKFMLLPTLLLLSSLVVAAMGGYIKYGVLEPLGIVREESIVAMPFVLHADKGLQFMVQMKRETAKQPVTEPAAEPSETTVPTLTDNLEDEAQTVAATEIPTEAPTEAPAEIVAVELDDSWFENMLIIGDSRIHGMRNYYRFGNAYYFTSIGMNIYNVYDTWEGDKGHYECSLDETLRTVSFDKVLVGIGLNECNYEHAFIEAGFDKLIKMIHGYQPDVKIILTSVMMVTEECSRRDKSFSIENLSAINEIIASFADNEKVFYVDVNEWAVDETGYLPKDLSFDGIHFYGEGYIAWGTWLRQKLGTLGIP